MPAEPAPGQAAYEAHAAMVVPRPWRWDQLDGELRAAWAAADAAVAAPLNAEIASLREQLAQAQRDLVAMRADRNRYAELTIRRGQGLTAIRGRLPLGRHAAPDECAEMDRIAREALEGGGDD